MSCLNKHSAQLEEVWLGGSRFYVHVEVTSYTNWKTTRVSLHFLAEGLQTGPCSFLHNWPTGYCVKWKKQPQEVAVPQVPFQQVWELPADGNTKGKDGQSSTGPFPAAVTRLQPRSSPSIPPTERKWALKMPPVFFWPWKTLMLNVLGSWKWEYQSLRSCSVKCSMNCSAYGRNRCLLLTIPPCWAVYPWCDNTGNSVLIFLFCPQIKLWEAK